jgi:hypothetical protein
MTIKASAALIFAAGLLMGAAGPSPATAEGDNAVAAKSEIATSTKSVRHARGMTVAMTEKAHTVLQAANKPAESEAPAEPDAVAADQPNTFDRSLTPSDQPAAESAQPAAATTQGVVLASTSRPSSEQAASNESSTLDKTSMIGKIFIAVGALLTVASAARMFMA